MIMHYDYVFLSTRGVSSNLGVPCFIRQKPCAFSSLYQACTIGNLIACSFKEVLSMLKKKIHKKVSLVSLLDFLQTMN